MIMWDLSSKHFYHFSHFSVCVAYASTDYASSYQFSCFYFVPPSNLGVILRDDLT